MYCLRRTKTKTKAVKAISLIFKKIFSVYFCLIYNKLDYLLHYFMKNNIKLLLCQMDFINTICPKKITHKFRIDKSIKKYFLKIVS